jgi:hypothetical protein
MASEISDLIRPNVSEGEVWMKKVWFFRLTRTWLLVFVFRFTVFSFRRHRVSQDRIDGRK